MATLIRFHHFFLLKLDDFSAGDEVIDNSSGVRQSAKIVFDDDFLSPVVRNAKKAPGRVFDDRIIDGQHEKQEGEVDFFHPRVC